MPDLSLIAAITWTPSTFYIAMGIVHTILILIGFRMLQVDVEHNSFVGAVLAAVIINVVAYFVRDTGIVGIMIAGSVIFGMLVAIASGEALKAALMAAVLVVGYGLVGSFITQRTPLTVDDIAGFPRVVMTGGLEAEPITEDDAKRMNEAKRAVE